MRSYSQVLHLLALSRAERSRLFDTNDDGDALAGNFMRAVKETLFWMPWPAPERGT
tara:strand:+ start:7438 stop:7605 length:168 start_codon:yes stop_codon:yes gene_type:complete